jgi:hypothetical protein
MFKSPTPEWSSTDATVTVLVGSGRMPAVSAAANLIQGTESVSARVDVDDMPSGRARHSIHLALIGDRAAVLDVLGQLAAAVDAAQVEPEPEASEDR